MALICRGQTFFNEQTAEENLLMNSEIDILSADLHHWKMYFQVVITEIMTFLCFMLKVKCIFMRFYLATKIKYNININNIYSAKTTVLQNLEQQKPDVV